MRHNWGFVFLFLGSLAMPWLLVNRDSDKFEWTSLGDSYASGVGSANYLGGRRCLRYDQAYPVLLNDEHGLADGKHTFNNVACSGAHYDDVEKYQVDEDTSDKTILQFGSRPKFGNPQMATLAIGGEDMDFPGILFNCILEAHILGGPPQRTCDDQREFSWGLIHSTDLVNKIDDLIQKTVARGQQGPIGEKFKLYVTGYGEFFNATDPGCNNVTFARAANPKSDGKNHTNLTMELRKDFNNMTRALNTAIQTAVDKSKDKGVKFVDIQGENALDGHRFCEPNVQEPDPKNDNLWFWHYPYEELKNNNTDLVQEAFDKVTQGPSTTKLSDKHRFTADYTNAIFDAIDYAKAQEVNEGDVEAKGFWSFIGSRTKVFHPKVPFHQHIEKMVFNQYKKDLDAEKAPDSPTGPDKNTCHGIGGDTWVMNRDVAVQNVRNFCAQESKSAEYNEGSVNHLRLSINFPANESKTPRDAPDCVKNFERTVIDGCDGNDMVKNPDNHKFGSTLTTGSGWVFKMEPLHKQINKDNSDVSYNFSSDRFTVRGKNWPDAKPSVNAEGLSKEL